MTSRQCFLLTNNPISERTIFSKNILETVGFHVNVIQCIPHENRVLSNKISMQYIYKIIVNGKDEWCYVFEDDINILEDIKIHEIIEYEKISNMFFYLGACMNSDVEREIHTTQINNHDVAILKGGVRGLHAIGISKYGAGELLSFSENMSDYIYMDMILEKFSERYPANLIRYDLESYIQGHKGIFFQDRNRFPSNIS
jgi:hypothetical protein